MGVDDFAYSGREELRIIEVMENYNRKVTNIFKKYVENPQKVVDFGAGIGTLALRMRDVGEVDCIEIDREQQEVIRARGFTTYGDIDELDEDSITFLYSSNVLEHIEDDYAAVAQIHEKMKVDGVAVFYVPAFQILFSSSDRRVGHVRRYGKKRLCDVFERAGFKIEKVCFVDFLGVFAVLLYKAFGPQDGRLDVRKLKTYDRFVLPLSGLFDLVFGRVMGKNLLLVARK